MAQFKNMYKVELNNGIAPVVSLKQIYYADVEANRIGAIVTMNGQPFPLSGTCTGSAILADGSTVPMTGVIDGNQAYIDLDSSCYSVEGQIKIFVKITTGGVTTTLMAAVGTVQLTETDTVIDPGTIIPSVSALITAIEDAVESIPADYTALLETIAPLYANLTFPVKAGQWCWYSGVLYEAKQDISTSENWTAAHWGTTTVGGSVSELKSALSDISNDVITSDNMFDGVFGITGGVNTEGTFNTNSNFVRSDYKKFKAGTNRTLYSKSSGNYWFSVYTYDASKTPIAAVGNNNPISDDAVYFIVYKQTASTGDYYVGITAFDDDYTYSTEHKIDASAIPTNTINRTLLNDFYEGHIPYIESGSDFNTIKKASIVMVNAGVTNTPNTTYGWFVKSSAIPWTSSATPRYNLLQIAYNRSDLCDQYIRTYDSGLGTFTSWLSITDYIKLKTNTNGLTGKKVVMMGDSTYAITGAGAGKHIANFLASIGNCTVYDCSFGGTRMSDSRDPSGSDSYKYFDMPKLVDAILADDFSDQESNLSGKAQEFTTNLATLESMDFSTVDFLLIAHGANDFTGNVPLGDGSIDRTTYTGAFAYCVDKLMDEYPNLIIIADSPRYRAWLGASPDYTFVDDVFTHTNELNKTTQDYVDALEEVSASLGCPFNNNLNHYGWNKYNRSVYFPTSDGAHFNEAGAKYAAKALFANLSMIGKAQSL